jgi:C4-dicarboxylate transporter DctQ subunit
VDRKFSALTKFYNVFREIAMWLLFADIFIIVVNIILRRFFNEPIYGVTEMIRYVMLFSASFALVENEWVEGNVSMLIILEKLSQRTRVMFFAIINFFITIVMIIVSCLLIQQSLNRFTEHTVSNELHLPLWIPEMGLAVGCCLLAVGLATKTILWFWMRRSENYFDFRERGFLKKE